MPPDLTPHRLSPARLFFAFFRVGLMGFGGVLPMIRRVMVEERRWLTALEFSELIALCQFLPGANVTNLAVIFGARSAGIAGSAAALAGLLGAPIVIVLALVQLYDRTSAIAPVRHLVTGLSAGAAGLVLSTAIKIALPLRGSLRGLIVAGAGFAALGLLRLPFLPSLCVLVPASIALAAWRVTK
jgi:chromate transporter